MTPAELLALADAATRLLSELDDMSLRITDDRLDEIRDELLKMSRNVPDLARLCAEMGEALSGVAILEMHPDFSDEENEELRRRAVAARAALAELSELEART